MGDRASNTFSGKSVFTDRRLVACAGVIGLVYSCSIVLGASFAETFSFDGAFGSPMRAIVSIGSIAILTCLFTIALAFAYRAIDQRTRATPKHHFSSTAKRSGFASVSFGAHLRERFLLYVAIIILAWLPTIVVHAPGTLTYDNYVQMLVNDGLTVSYSAHNPPFDTWLYSLFWSLGDALGNRSFGLALHTVFQCVLTAAGLAASFCWLRLIQVPKTVRACLFALACLLPIFPLSAECMTKDYSFATVFLFWSLMICETVRTKGRFLERAWAIMLFVLTTVLLMMTKKTGVYVAAPVAILAMFVLRKTSIRLLLSTLGAAFIYLVLFEMAFFSLFGIVNGSSREMLSIPMQQTARCALEHPDDATEAENAAITNVFGEDWQANLAASYNPTISDPVKSQYDPYASTLDTLAYFAAWASQGARHPITYLESFFSNTYECAYPFILLDQEMDVPEEWDSLEFASSLTIYTREGVTPEAVYGSIGGVHSFSTLSEARGSYNDAYEAVVSLPILNVLTSKALYAVWIPLFAVGCLVYRRQTSGLLMLSPTLLCLFALLAGPVSQSRYITPELYVFALVVGLCWTTTRDAAASPQRQSSPPARAAATLSDIDY